MAVSGVPTRAGRWQVAHVTYQGHDRSGRLPAGGEWVVDRLSVTASALGTAEKILAVGDPIIVDLALQNDAETPLLMEDLYVRGVRPDEPRNTWSSTTMTLARSTWAAPRS